jgi:diphosphomevalonate decarboxylase
LEPNSLAIIKKIRDFRQQTGLAVGFTIDAGPNIHLLYFGYDKQKVHQFIEIELLELTEGGKWLDDCIGDGPIKLKG